VPLASNAAILRRRNVFVIISLLSTIRRSHRNATRGRAMHRFTIIGPPAEPPAVTAL
jgi:hypothetical protein